MAKRRMGIIGLLIYVCLCLIPCNAHAASTADAKEMIQPERPCTITVSYVYNGTAFSDLSVKLYKIADVSADFQYTPTTRFQSTGLRLNGVQSAGEWNVIRSTLEAHIIANAIVANDTAATDRTGRVQRIYHYGVRYARLACFRSGVWQDGGLDTEGYHGSV